MWHLSPHQLCFTQTKQNVTSVSKIPHHNEMDFLYFALKTHGQLLTWKTYPTIQITEAFQKESFPLSSFACQHTPVILPQGGDETDRTNWRHS